MAISAIKPLLLTAVTSLLAGAVAEHLHIPLPWMLGPLLITALLGMRGVKTAVVEGGRQAGQLVIGLALGHYFTAPVIQAMANDAIWLLLNCLAALSVGLLSMRLLLPHLTRATAFFAMLPGGAAEMAVLGARHGGEPAIIALCHTIRVVLVVSTVPIGMVLSGASGADTYQPLHLTFSVSGIALLVILGVIAGWVCSKAKLPNAWLFGPLLMSVVLTANGLPLSAVPHEVVNMGQWLIGSALGCRFRQGMFSQIRQIAKRIMAAIILSQVLLLAFGLLLAWLHHVSVPTAILATAPGGLAEMCLTARNLHLGVAYITASQLARLVFLLVCSQPLYYLYLRCCNRSG